MAITDWPIAERPREKLLQRGAKALSDAELLAIFLRTGIPGKTAVDLARDLLNEHGSLRRLLGADQTRQFLIARLRDLPHEVFGCLFLDNRHRIICFDELFRGTIDGASVHPREIVRQTLKHNTAAVIFAHNHPFGVAEPSAADRNLTQRLKQALALIDVRVLDHFLIGDGVATSFADRDYYSSEC